MHEIAHISSVTKPTVDRSKCSRHFDQLAAAACVQDVSIQETSKTFSYRKKDGGIDAIVVDATQNGFLEIQYCCARLGEKQRGRAGRQTKTSTRSDLAVD